MSNVFQNVTSGVAELKNFYEGPIVDQFSEDLMIVRAAEKIKKGWSGTQVNRPLRTSRNQGIGATSDGGNLPAIGRQGTKQATILAKYNYLRFGITGPMIKASQSDVGSFVRSAAYELQMGYKDLMNDMNRQFGWDGTNTLAKMSSAAAGTNVITVKGRETNDPAIRFLDINMLIDIYTSAGVVKASGVNIDAISGAPTDTTATLTLNAAVTAAADDLVIRSGTWGNEVQGMFTTLDGGTTTVYGIDRSTVQVYQSNVRNLAGQLTIDALQGQYNEGLRRGGAKYNACNTDFTGLRYYQKLLTPDKRYANTQQGDGTFGKKDQFYLEFMGLPVVPDKDFPQRFSFTPAEALKNYLLSEMEFADETGSMYIAQSGVDALEVRIRYFNNLFNEQPAACGVLTGYTAP